MLLIPVESGIMISPKIAQLTDMIETLVALLRRHGESHWSMWLAADAERLRHGDDSALAHLLSAYGGMGSLNDLVLSHRNGHEIDEKTAGPANRKLSELRSRIHALARDLQRTA